MRLTSGILNKLLAALSTLVFCATAFNTIAAWGWGDGSSILLAMAIAIAIPVAASSFGKWCGSTGRWILVCAGVVLAAVAIHYIWSVTTAQGATLEMPTLNCDSKGYYNWALNHYDGRCPEPRITFFGLPLAMVVLWSMFGVSIVWPVALNVGLTLFTIALCGHLTSLLTRQYGREQLFSNIAMAALALHGYFMSQGAILLKEAMVYLPMTLIAIVLFKLTSDDANRRWLYILVYFIACLILAIVRAKYINFAAFGVVLLALGCWRRQWRAVLTLAVCTGITWYLGMYWSTTYTVAQQLNNVAGGEYMYHSMGPSDNGMHLWYLDLLGGYFVLPAWKKILLLPFTVGTQYIIPFPWGAEHNVLESVLPRMNMMWYLVGGIAGFYYLFLSWRRDVSLGLVAWWPALTTVAIAYISGGTVARYILPLSPVFTAIAVYVVAVVLGGSHRKAFVCYSIAFALLLAAALTTGFFLS